MTKENILGVLGLGHVCQRKVRVQNTESFFLAGPGILLRLSFELFLSFVLPIGIEFRGVIVVALDVREKEEKTAKPPRREGKTVGTGTN